MLGGLAWVGMHLGDGEDNSRQDINVNINVNVIKATHVYRAKSHDESGRFCTLLVSWPEASVSFLQPGMVTLLTCSSCCPGISLSRSPESELCFLDSMSTSFLLISLFC